MTHLIDKDLQRIIGDSIKYLEKNQAKDGSFLGQASADGVNFRNPRIHSTAFFTSLIVSCLKGIASASTIKEPAITFILNSKSNQGAWNYWLPDSVDAQQRPYPDDLDDTACALSAIAVDDTTYIEGGLLGAFARHLVSQDTALGGPYTTWLVGDTKDPQWKDVDIAVNANIGYLLTGQQSLPDGLSTFITDAIRNENIESKYYYTSIPVLYFIARWYKGEEETKLTVLIKEAIKKLDMDNPLHISMLITCCCRLGLRRDAQLLVGSLLKLRTGHAWKACTLYYEPPLEGVPQYAGSSALTTAFAVEAIQIYAKQDTEKTKLPQPRNPKRMNVSVKGLEPEFAQNYTNIVQLLIDKDVSGQVSRIASITESSTGRKNSLSTVRSLNSASVHGWASYTIFDDILDGDTTASLLPLATFLLRRSVADFNKALPADSGFQAFVQATLDKVDAANAWEMEFARVKIENQKLIVKSLPVYDGMDRLCDRSLGHQLASAGILLEQGEKLQSSNQRKLASFYRYYIIARQLNDDAHDWLSDIYRGQLSFVVTEFLATYRGRTSDINIDLSNPAVIGLMKEHYWTQTIPRVVTEIKNNIRLARVSLSECKAINKPGIFEAWLDGLEKSAETALIKRNESQSFIDSFTNGFMPTLEPDKRS